MFVRPFAKNPDHNWGGIGGNCLEFAWTFNLWDWTAFLFSSMMTSRQNRRLLMRIRPIACLIVAGLVLVGFRPAHGAAATRPAQVGAFRISFTERTAASAISAVAARMGWTVEAIRKTGDEFDFDLKNESFEGYVPRDYMGETAYGLLVWVSPGSSGTATAAWIPALDRHKLIWIGANKSGNERSLWCRMALAIDGAGQMKARYNIDPNRIYVAGVSGGGRVSSMLAVCFPDVFRGGYYIVGCNYYRQMPSKEQPGRFFRKTFSPPPDRFLILAKRQSRHVMLTGETDANREQTNVYYEAFKRDGFQHVTYFEVPGMGHQAPDADWFEKGLSALDEGGR
jgi:hypothetical protein